MDVKEAIGKRRSIRKYLDKPVPKEMIQEIINAARLAPSGNNTQPSKYFIIEDELTKKRLSDKETIKDKWVYEAPLIIVCCTNPNSYSKSLKEWDDPNEIRAIRDLSIASSYLDLRATELGLGTCYCGWVKEKELKEILNIPSDFLIPYVITVGFPNESPNPRPRKNIDEIVF